VKEASGLEKIGAENIDKIEILNEVLEKVRYGC
jgi:hypothetical protein